MITQRCEKCKNIGCNNDNFICNNWSEDKRKEYSEQYKSSIIKLEDISYYVTSIHDLEKLVKITPNDIKLGEIIRQIFQ